MEGYEREIFKGKMTCDLSACQKGREVQIGEREAISLRENYMCKEWRSESPPEFSN